MRRRTHSPRCWASIAERQAREEKYDRFLTKPGDLRWFRRKPDGTLVEFFPDDGKHRIVPIVYGEPTPELEYAAREGELILGGCVVDDSSPTRYCLTCRAAW